MRAIWTGEISFGLVAIPVKLYSATRDLTPHFHLIHKSCGTRIQQKRSCPKHEKEVPWDEVEKGYEVHKGKYAKFSKEEIAELEGEDAAEGVDIVEFIDPHEIDLAYIEKSYWVGAAGKSARSYDLLRTALEKSHKVAVARVKLRTRTRLALVRPREGRFALDMMRFGDEIVPAKDIEVPTVRKHASGKELDLALDLIKRMTGDFDPAAHPDDYRKAVLAAVENKEEHEELAEDVQPAKGGKLIDLAEMLSQSLSTVSRGKRKTSGRTAKTHVRGTKKSTHRKAARRTTSIMNAS